MEFEKNLIMCSVCKRIQIDEKNNLWLGEKDDSNLYKIYLTTYQNRISHGLCSDDYERELKKI